MEIEYSRQLKQFRFNKTHIKSSTVFDLKQKMGWEGSGTPKDPIVIDNVKGLEPNIVFHNCNLCFILRHVKLIMVFCKNTQNIIIENCKIYELNLQGCYNIYLKNSKIVFFKTIFTRESIFENNEIYVESLSNLEVNHDDNLIRFQYKTILFILFGLITTALANFVFFNWEGFYLILLVPIIGLVYVYIIFKKRELRTRDMGLNKIIDNAILINHNEITNELIQEYQNHKANRAILYLLILIGGILGLLLLYVSSLLDFLPDIF